MRFVAQRDICWDCVSLMLLDDSSSPIKVARPYLPELKDHKEGEPEEPWMRLNPNDAVRLLDALLIAGVQPSRELLKQRNEPDILRHLEDMRAIAFAKTGVQKP